MVATVLLLAAIAFGVGWFLGHGPEPAEELAGGEVAGEPSRALPKAAPSATATNPKPRPQAVTPGNHTPGAGAERAPAPGAADPQAGAQRPSKGPLGRIAIVIDDLGRSVADIDRLGKLGVPITYAVLPFEHSTPQVVARLAGKEVLIHLPMAPVNGRDPGPGALVEGMSAAELTAATRAALEQVPGAVGVNNHMGSGITADPVAMGAILAVIGERGLFFLDSRTTAASVGYRLALERGIPSAERQVFLDPDLSVDAIRAQFQRLLDIAREQGAAVAIGHPHTTTLDVLEAEVPRALAAGYEVVPVSYLLDRASAVE